MNAQAAGPAVRRLADWSAADLADLADEYGTPLYVTDLDRVRENATRLRAAFDADTDDVDVRYAVKAHTGRAVLETVRESGLGAECASAGEVVRALDAGYDSVQYTAVNPPAEDLDVVLDRWRDGAEVTIVAGARDTVTRLRERGFDGRLAIRVNPGVGAGHHEKVTTGGHAKFGVPYDRAAALVDDARADFDVVGIHAHAGSGISGDDLEAHRELVSRMGDLARSVGPLEFVDIGGGFGVPYREADAPLDLDAVADATKDALGPVDATLAVEPGRYVVADAGVLLTRVNTVKPVDDEGSTGSVPVVAGVDAGMTTLLRPAMYDAYHAIRNLTDQRPERPVTVAGPVCETADLFCEERPMPAPRRDDLLAIGNAGAYGYEMASTYNSRPRPAEVVLDGDKVRLARERETIAGLTALEVDR
ncbi:diaminopimelate decarboxylase [Haloplanus vescus]|uniref:Diaminopimelate decarboxylase n=1 Tax=Haloplanus vescus TaxID=555874 RepID=A0A1H3W0Q0_9EURY|nr:diaminopimelate decarboxylase [Haloplanus vescus]SDZ80629.1 diaminopimelate decarboxylase [Haloplanus vescus]